ncbi:MAG: CBS domain-containing protein [Candidatus Aenigmarchaeota archaeon]|nr:CBS domain-containing protein [Candidatus Aenigmarchaeota archaeon]
MLVNDVMNRKVVVVKKDATVKEASQVMARLGIGSLVVVEDEKIVGMLTNHHIVKSVAEDKPAEGTLVEDLMSERVVTIEPGKELNDAVETMVENKVREIPVVEEGKIKGILSVTDIAVVEPKLIASIANLLQMQLPGYKAG